MVHQGSTTVLLCLVIFMATSLVTPACALLFVDMFKSKDEALAHCNSIQGPKDGYYSVYPQGGKDVIYSCRDNEEKQSKFKAGTPCDLKSFRGAKESPVSNIYHQCENGHLQIARCTHIGPKLVCDRVTKYK